MTTILYLNTDLRDPQQSMKRAGMRRYALMRGWSVSSVPIAQSAPARVAERLARERPLGVVVECSSGLADFPSELFGGLPVVYFDAPPLAHRDRTARIAPDNAAIVRSAMRELSATHPAAFAFVGYYFPTPWEHARRAAFRAQAAASSLPWRVFRRRREDHDDHGARACRLARWLAVLPPRTAVLAVNDQIAADVVAAAQTAGRRIPHDLALVGVDNLASWVESSSPPITSVQVDFERAGWRAAQLLDRQIAGRHPAPAVETYGPMLCVRRESTRGVGRREPRIQAAVERIRREACDGIAARDVAAAQPGSRRLFELRFREAMGHSVLDEILSVRLEKACALLANTDTPVELIPERCGFGSGRALRALFLARMGVSMRAFRAQNGPVR